MSRDWRERDHPRFPRGSGDQSGEFRDTQPAGWAAAVAGQLGDPGPGRIRQTLASRLKRSGPQRGGSMAATRLREHDDGNLIEKRYPGEPRKTAREVAAAHVGRALGLDAHVPAAIVDPDDPETLHAEYVQATIAGDLASHSAGWFPQQQVARSRGGLQTGFFDSLISNGDRHSENWMVDPQGRLVLIDHGEAMNTLYDGGHSGITGEIQPKAFKHVGFSDPFITIPGVEYPGPTWRDGNPLHPDDIPELRARLQALQPVFAGMQLDREYKLMMERFEALSARAGGSVRLFP